MHIFSTFNLSVREIVFSKAGIGTIVKPDYFVLECLNSAQAEFAVQGLYVLRVMFVFLYFIFISRYFFFIFANMDITQNTLLLFIYRLSQPLNRIFLGIIPSLYGFDAGIYVTYILLDKLDFLLSHIIVVNEWGIAFN
jgi:uncharacterized protein YggT (Ycf19 family)